MEVSCRYCTCDSSHNLSCRVLLAVRMFHGDRIGCSTSWLSRQQGSKPTAKSSNDATLADMMYDYIIGAGPAGIITADGFWRFFFQQDFVVAV
jgi:hypothetical protein